MPTPREVLNVMMDRKPEAAQNMCVVRAESGRELRCIFNTSRRSLGKAGTVKRAQV